MTVALVVLALATGLCVGLGVGYKAGHFVGFGNGWRNGGAAVRRRAEAAAREMAGIAELAGHDTVRPAMFEAVAILHRHLGD